jgi:hypothetical protein
VLTPAEIAEAEAEAGLQAELEFVKRGKEAGRLDLQLAAAIPSGPSTVELPLAATDRVRLRLCLFGDSCRFASLNRFAFFVIA